MSQSCPSCGKPASGRFCAECGAALTPTHCAQCGHELPEGGRFCNMCGASARGGAEAEAGAPRPSSRLPWIVGGVALVVLGGVLILPRMQEEIEPALEPVPGSTATATTPPAGAAGGAAGVDLSSMTPREAADRLFNRVMTSASSGDSAQARTFVPMAIAAYDRVEGIDLDGRYHIALLQLVNGAPQAAIAQTDTILSAEPNHLLALFTAAQAREALGDEEEARTLYRRFLEHYDSEIGRALPEYRDHAPSLPTLRTEAQSAAGPG